MLQDMTRFETKELRLLMKLAPSIDWQIAILFLEAIEVNSVFS